jgi:parallel beta-helix repeat protein
MKIPTRGRVRRHGWSLAAVLAVLDTGTPLVHAEVSCGDVIGPNQVVSLTRDLGPCPAGPAALTVVGPATLDLNGFAVTCVPARSGRPTGIVAVGRRATVRNGSVQGCGTGVEVLGEGAHRIEGVTAALTDDGGGGDGFVVESDGNRLLGNAAVQNGGNGFRVVVADRNRLTGNVAFFNDRAGFEVQIGVGNVLQDNRASDNAIMGFHIDAGPFSPGGGRNTVKRNTSTGNQTGFYVDGEDGSRLTGNTARTNRTDGIFLIFADRVKLAGNTSQDNGESGIVVAASDDTVVSRNTALNNDRAPDTVQSFDLLETLTGCGTNRWRGNVFVTSNEPCIR